MSRTLPISLSLSLSLPPSLLARLVDRIYSVFSRLVEIVDVGPQMKNVASLSTPWSHQTSSELVVHCVMSAPMLLTA